jgi:uncharacterized membrane protein YjjP (DUF1212 family)
VAPPLAPQPDAADVSLTLDLALRIGEVFLSSGAGAADVAATMLSICRVLGLRSCEVDVTFTTLSLSYQPGGGMQGQTMMRQVRQRVTDYTDLTEIDLLVTALLTGEVDRDEARSTVASVVSTGHRYPRVASTIGWGFMGMGASIVIGGDWIVTLIAFVAACGVDVIRLVLSRQRLPTFYQQAAGGIFATLLAVAAVELHIEVDPSLVVTAGIIMLLSGIAFMGAVQDALTGYYVTSGARGLEALLLTGGTIAGVSGGLAVASRAGVVIVLRPAASGWSELPIVLFGAALTAAAFGFASYSPIGTLLPLAGVGALGELVSRSVLNAGFGPAWAAAAAAVVIGLVGYPIAERIRVPPLVIVVCGIVPLLPGLSIFKGLFLMAEGDTNGLIDLATALAIALALASGVILGEFVAQPLRREAHRLEQRLSGPRLIGPFRAHRPRRDVTNDPPKRH